MLVQDGKVVFWIVEKWKVAAVFNREYLSAGIAADEIGRASCRERVCQYV